MRLRFIYIGKAKSRFIAQGCEHFMGRLRPFCRLEERVLKDAAKRGLSDERVKMLETERIIECVEPGEMLVLLDPAGKSMRSEELAGWLGRQRDQGLGSLAFGLGGPLGLSPAGLERAGLTLSLSPLTMTHELARLVLLEQLYRAMTILNGHPYHK